MKNESVESNLATLLLTQLSDSALSGFIARALSPTVAGNKEWDALMQGVAARAEDIAKDSEARKNAVELEFADSFSHNAIDDWDPSPAKAQQLAAFSRALSLKGPQGEVAAERFKQTFGSAQWIQWMAEAGVKSGEMSSAEAREDAKDFILSVFQAQEAPGNKALLEMARFWLRDEYFEEVVAARGDTALKECMRLGFLEELLVGEVFEGVARQHRSKGYGKKKWSAEVVAVVESAVLKKELAQVDRAAVLPGQEPSVERTAKGASRL